MMQKIVIIDDDEGVIDALTAALSLWGYESIGVSNPDEAVQIIQREHPLVIFLDLLLSGTDGVKVAKKIRRAQKGTRTPIVLMSAHPTAKFIAQTIAVDEFLSKPFDLDTLHATLNSVTHQ